MFAYNEQERINAEDDNYVIDNYCDEWSWFMQGFKETLNYKKHETDGK